MKTLSAALLIALSLAMTAGAAAPACEDGRLKGDRYFGAFRACLKSNSLRLQDLDEAIASAEPFHPLSKHTPEKNAIIAKGLFDSLVTDPAVRAHWSETQERLRVLRAELGGLDQVREKAERETERVIAPVSIGELPGLQLAWTTLPDGTPATARWSLQGDREILVTRPNGAPIASFKGEKNQLPWNLLWHYDKAGTLWLYLLSRSVESTGRWNVYRAAWGKDTAMSKVEIPEPLLALNPHTLIDVGPGYLLVTLVGSATEICNLEASPVETLNIQKVTHPQAAAVSQTGELVQPRFLNHDIKTAILTGPSGRTFSAEAHYHDILVRGPDLAKEIKISEPNISHIRLYESPEGELFVATLAEITERKRALNVYKVSGGDTPVYSKEIKPVSDFLDRAHFFTLAGDRTFFGYSDGGTFTIADLKTKSEVFEIPAVGPINSWFDSSGQVYIGFNGNQKVEVYQVLSEGRK